ncbi:helix-turn-helix domain-containing protein [Evansella halocellulosilytica]|uniref:helix-turn-helix domain-containing protein n=1 Tax=Evansella halocellulosilytica TaxID=2011013 RepID=UPI000BB86F7F|nr:helix-turn-helix transcriptional regulator [Evansella halocellulosilytica]
MLYKDIGDKVKELRKGKLTQKELGEKLGFSESYMGHLESGRRKISLKMLEKISMIFDVDITYFFMMNRGLFLLLFMRIKIALCDQLIDFIYYFAVIRRP